MPSHVDESHRLDAAYVASIDDPPKLKARLGHSVTLANALEFLIDKILDRNSRTPSSATQLTSKRLSTS